MRIWPRCIIVARMDLFHLSAWTILLHVNVKYCECFNQTINYGVLYPKYYDYNSDNRNSLNQKRTLC